MVLDTSALLAILFDEPDAERFAHAIAEAPRRLLSAANRVEAMIVAESRKRAAGPAGLDALLAEAAVEIVAVTADQAELACEAFRRFAKGRHAAGLNLGDVFAYALARATGEPLLFKGDDFAATDIPRAV